MNKDHFIGASRTTHEEKIAKKIGDFLRFFFQRLIPIWIVDTSGTSKKFWTLKVSLYFDELNGYVSFIYVLYAIALYRCYCHWWNHSIGKLDWGFWYVSIFLYVHFWIRLAAVSHRHKTVRTVTSPAVRSVNKSRDTRNCVQNESEYAICVILTIILYHKSLGLILCDLVWQIRNNYIDNGHGDITGHRKMSVLGAVDTMETTHENLVMI